MSSQPDPATETTVVTNVTSAPAIAPGDQPANPPAAPSFWQRFVHWLRAPDPARRSAISAMIMLLLILFILMLIAAATERTDILKFAGLFSTSAQAQGFTPQFQNSVPLNDTTRAGPVPAAGSGIIAVDARFKEYYDSCGGLMIFGQPLTPAMQENGRLVQWFERARLELPSDSRLGVQRGRIGAEYLANTAFPKPQPFRDRVGARYFSQTGHAIVAPFLGYWEQIGGVSGLGYPLSEQLQEVQTNNRILTVQYFERGRLEWHPEHSGTPHTIQLGLVGRAVYLREAQPNLIPPVQPTAIP
jgi:hypothetical protein